MGRVPPSRGVLHVLNGFLPLSCESSCLIAGLLQVDFLFRPYFAVLSPPSM
jgi:hypothetical protein